MFRTTQKNVNYTVRERWTKNIIRRVCKRVKNNKSTYVINLFEILMIIINVRRKIKKKYI